MSAKEMQSVSDHSLSGRSRRKFALEEELLIWEYSGP